MGMIPGLPFAEGIAVGYQAKVYTYTYIYIEREREREIAPSWVLF